jgi:hypothetical protein
MFPRLPADDLGDVFEAAMHDPDSVPERSETLPGRGDCVCITIDAEQCDVRSGLEEEVGVPTASDRRIDDGSRRHRCEELEHFPGHHRFVLEAIHPSPSRFTT